MNSERADNCVQSVCGLTGDSRISPLIRLTGVVWVTCIYAYKQRVALACLKLRYDSTGPVICYVVIKLSAL